MTRYAALLRAVNLGPSNRVSMPALRQWVTAAGFTAVETYLATGNVVFSGEPEEREVVAAKVAERIASETGSSVDVIVVTCADLTDAVENLPYRAADESKVLVCFLSARLPQDAIPRLEHITVPPDEFTVAGPVAYLHCPDGIGRSKLAAGFGRAVGKPVGDGEAVFATARNIRTVRAIRDLTCG